MLQTNLSEWTHSDTNDVVGMSQPFPLLTSTTAPNHLRIVIAVGAITN